MAKQSNDEQPKTEQPSKLFMLGIIFGIFIIVGVAVFVFAKPCIPCSFKLLQQAQELENK
jgi:hypothetical protein